GATPHYRLTTTTTPHHTTLHYTTLHHNTPHYNTDSSHYTAERLQPQLIHYTTPHYRLTTTTTPHHTTPHYTTPHYRQLPLLHTTLLMRDDMFDMKCSF